MFQQNIVIDAQNYREKVLQSTVLHFSDVDAQLFPIAIKPLKLSASNAATYIDFLRLR
jgi:hypothetical protein